MNVNEAYPSTSTYVKAADLQNRDVLCTIVQITQGDETIDRKLVVHFMGKEKALVLNKTNARTIAAIYGDETTAWVNNQVVLYTAMVDFQGKIVPAIRVKGPVNQPIQQQAQAPFVPDQPPVQAHEAARQNTPSSTHVDLEDNIPF